MSDDDMPPLVDPEDDSPDPGPAHRGWDGRPPPAASLPDLRSGADRTAAGLTAEHVTSASGLQNGASRPAQPAADVSHSRSSKLSSANSSASPTTSREAQVTCKAWLACIGVCKDDALDTDVLHRRRRACIRSVDTPSPDA